MVKITKRQFDAFFYSKQPLARLMSDEVAWFEVFDKKLLAVIVFDKTDSDYLFVILGRDSNNLFRTIETSDEFYLKEEDAIDGLKKVLKKYESDGKTFYPQGEKRTPNEILKPQVSKEKLHEYFKLLINDSKYEAAKNIIKEGAYSFFDVDGNFIKDFQSTGFDSRLWELYLHIYFYFSGFEVINEHQRPDFQLSYFGETVFVEAVTVNPTQGNNSNIPKAPSTFEEALPLIESYVPIKFGSALYSKLQKKYWELDYVNTHPFIIAIHDFHMPGSMTWSQQALSEYLYRRRTRIKLDKNNEQVELVEDIQEHSWDGKTIPSGFFSQPDSENVSAILFSNAATLTKFNRMGKLAGLAPSNIHMIRQGYRFNPNGDQSLLFSIDIDDSKYEESWEDELIMFHNPNAVAPVDPNLFPNITHAFFNPSSKKFYTDYNPNFVYSSITIVAEEKDIDEE